MTIALNNYLNIVTDPDTGEKKLFGKCGYQTMHKGTDKYTLINMAAIERAMLAGELRDINGDVAKDGALVELVARVTLVKPDSDIEQVGTIRTTGGLEASVPDAPTPVAGAVANPLGGSFGS